MHTHTYTIDMHSHYVYITCMCAHIHAHICTYARIHRHTPVYTYARTHALYMRAYTYIYICIYIFTHALHTNIFNIYICTHARTHTGTHMVSLGQLMQSDTSGVLSRSTWDATCCRNLCYLVEVLARADCFIFAYTHMQ